MYNRGFTPISGWQAKLIKIGVTQVYKSGPYSVVGEIHLLPSWEDREVDLGSRKKFHLNAVVRCINDDWQEKLLRVPEGTHLFVSGDLGHRPTTEDFPHLKTSCWIEDFCVDLSNGTVTSVAAQLLVPSREEYNSAADSRFASECPACAYPTIPIAGSEARFCPICKR